MNKIFKIIVIIFLSLFTSQKLIADTTEVMTEEKFSNIYYVRRGGGLKYVSGPYANYNMDGKVVYCIEPGAAINTHSYIGKEGAHNTGFSDELNRLLELIGYYGYDYPGHQTQKYRLATQALIWSNINGQIVEYYTEHYGYGDYIDDSYERNEIMRLVNAHYIKPSFDNSNINLVLGESINLTDTNNILNDYYISSNNITAEKTNNNLKITSSQVGNYNIVLTKIKYDNLPTMIYSGNGTTSQRMGFFRYNDIISSVVNVNVFGGTLDLNKLDSITGTNKSINSSLSLENAEYGIYNTNNNLLYRLFTDSNGHANITNALQIGEYYLKEITPSKGYMLDENKYYFTISKDNLYQKVDVYENAISKDIEINKFIIKNEKLIGEKNITFEIYNNNELIKEVTTDSNGKIITNLNYGNYIIKQKNTTKGYRPVDDFIININENSNDLVFNLLDESIKTRIHIIKVDKDTLKPINSDEITFKIKNKDTNKYICNNNICEFKTDLNGEIKTTFELEYGNYELEEIISPKGYKELKNNVAFTIDENSKINNIDGNNYLDITVYNEKETKELIINKYGETKYNTFIPFENITFNLYANEDIVSLDSTIHYKKGEKVSTCKTDAEGKCYIIDLYYGTYKLEEINESNIYKTSENKIIDLTDSSIIELKINNYLKKGILNFTKIDSITKEPLKDSKIEIYNEQNELIFSGLTNTFGKIDISSLPIGTYKLLEVLSPNGYINNTEEISFEIKEDEETIINLENQKDVIEVPNTLSNIKFINIFLIATILFIIKYVKKH